MELAIIIAVVVVALVFDYTNGFHDAANAIATSVSTGALKPRVALAMAAVMNFVGAFLGQKVAQTVSDTIDPGPGSHGLVIVMCGLLGAITWNLITWYSACRRRPRTPSSAASSAPPSRPARRANWAIVLEKVVIPMFVSPVVAFSLGFALMLAIMWIFRSANPSRVNRGFKIAQTVSAAAMALGHGLQDAQKTMGVIFLALLTGGYVTESDGLPALGDHRGRDRDLARHLVRRLAHHAHPGSPDHPPRPAAWLRRRVGRGVASSTRRRTSSRRRSRPPTPSPPRSWASAPPSASPPCAGVSRSRSSRPGS